MLFAFDIQSLSSQKLFNDTVQYDRYVLKQLQRFPIVVNVMRLKNNHYRANLVTKAQPYPLTTFDILRASDAFFATNGGYYREGFQPNGLLIDQGVRKSRMVQNRLLSAIVKINAEGLISLGGLGQNLDDAQYAFQVGPIIYEKGVYRKTLADIKQAKRTVYGQTKQGDIIVMNIAYATMQQTVEVVKALAELNQWDWQMVVNFDGGQASAFIIDLPSLSIVIPEQSVVKFVMLFSSSE